MQKVDKKIKTAVVKFSDDDLIIAASNNELPNRFKDLMKAQFNIKDLGKISCFLIQLEQRELESCHK